MLSRHEVWPVLLRTNAADTAFLDALYEAGNLRAADASIFGTTVRYRTE